MESLEFENKIRSGGNVSIVTIPDRIMEVCKLNQGDKVKIKLTRVK